MSFLLRIRTRARRLRALGLMSAEEAEEAERLLVELEPVPAGSNAVPSNGKLNFPSVGNHISFLFRPNRFPCYNFHILILSHFIL